LRIDPASAPQEIAIRSVIHHNREGRTRPKGGAQFVGTKPSNEKVVGIVSRATDPAIVGAKNAVAGGGILLQSPPQAGEPFVVTGRTCGWLIWFNKRRQTCGRRYFWPLLLVYLASFSPAIPQGVGSSVTRPSGELHAVASRSRRGNARHLIIPDAPDDRSCADAMRRRNNSFRRSRGHAGGGVGSTLMTRTGHTAVSRTRSRGTLLGGNDGRRTPLRG
jgi:hypothetical protein